MNMPVLILALCFMFLLQPFEELVTKGEEASRQKRSPLFILSEGLSILADAVEFGKSIYDIIHDEKLDSEMEAIIHRLESMDENFKRVDKYLQTIIYEIKWSVYQSQIAENKRFILDCYDKYVYVLRNPQSLKIQSGIQSCIDDFEYTQDIGRMLSGQPITYHYKPIFELQIDSKGHCDNNDLSMTRSYLLTLYYKGCLAATVAESFKYNASISRIRDTCANVFNASEQYHFKLEKLCSQESCSITSDTIRRVVNHPMTCSSAANLLAPILPWFDVLILKSKTKPKPTRSGFFNLRTTSAALSSDTTSLRVFWTPKSQFRQNLKSNSYAIVTQKIHKSEVLDSYVGAQFKIEEIVIYDTAANSTEINVYDLTYNETYLLISGPGDKIGKACASYSASSVKRSYDYSPELLIFITVLTTSVKIVI